jgi:hypothetical protein
LGTITTRPDAETVAGFSISSPLANCHSSTGLAHKTALAFLHPEVKEQALMVKRRKEEDIAAGVLEFEGRTAQDPEFMDWVVDHRKQNGGKIRVSKGWKGVRVVFSKEADLTLWKTRSEQAARGKKSTV